MKFNAHRHVSAQTLRGLVPKKFHQQFKWSKFKGVETAVLIFPHDRSRGVVISSAVRSALESINDLSETHRVAVGRNFTQEAIEILATAGFSTYSLSDFFWTDNRYKHITKATT